jgi:8-oxo-dGTP pyrophosphatase MutT (NUDIX family)
VKDILNTFYRISVKALILDGQKRFLLEREDNGLWDFPGGGIDHGDNPIETIKREIMEKMGIEVLNVNPTIQYFVIAKALDNVWKSSVFYLTRLKNLDFTPTEECKEIRFFTKEEANEVDTYPVVKAFLKEFDPARH